MLLKIIDDQFLLLDRSMLDHGLQDSAPIMLVNQLFELFFFSDRIDTFLNESSLIFVCLLQLLLLHQELVVVDSELLDQVRHFGLNSSLLRIGFVFWIRFANILLTSWSIFVLINLSLFGSICVLFKIFSSNKFLWSSLVCFLTTFGCWLFAIVIFEAHSSSFRINCSRSSICRIFFVACFLLSLFIQYVHLIQFCSLFL